MFGATRMGTFALAAPLFAVWRTAGAATCDFEDAEDAHNWVPGWVNPSEAIIVARYQSTNPSFEDGYTIDGVDRNQPDRFWDIFDMAWDGTQAMCEAWCDQLEGPNGELCAFAAWQEPEDTTQALCQIFSCVPNCYSLNDGKAVATASCPDWNTVFHSSVKNAKTWANLCVVTPTCTTSTTSTSVTTTTTTSATTTTTTTGTTTTTTTVTTTTTTTGTTTTTTTTTTGTTTTTTSVSTTTTTSATSSTTTSISTTTTTSVSTTTTSMTTTTTTPVITDYRLVVARGPCELSMQDMCVSSPNYPGAYPTGDDNACAIFGPAGVKIKVWGFSTEYNKDVLYVNGNAFSGSLTPAGETLTKDAISWIPQGTAAGGAASGWWICLDNATETTTATTTTTTTITTTTTTATTTTSTSTTTTSTSTHTSMVETNTEAIVMYDVDLELRSLSAGEISNLEGQLLNTVAGLPFVGMQFVHSIELQAGNRGTSESAVIDPNNPFAVLGVVAKVVLKPQAAAGLAKAAADALERTKKGSDIFVSPHTFTIDGVFSGFAVVYHPMTTSQTTTTTIDLSLLKSTGEDNDDPTKLDSPSVAIIIVTVMIAFVLVVVMVYMWVNVPKEDHEFQTLKYLAREAVGEANDSRYHVPASSPTAPPSTTSKLIMETVNATGAALYGSPAKFGANNAHPGSSAGLGGVSPTRHYKPPSAAPSMGSMVPSLSNVDANDSISTLLRGGGGPRSASQSALPKVAPAVEQASGGSKGFSIEDIGALVTVYGYTGEGRLAFYGKHVEFGTPRCGVVFDSPIGRNDGTVGGHAYFKCPANCGVLVAPGKVELADE